uniref:Uncharacterized protein n=1 Tax=Oryza punctata TaxID=4537 RepID=A0A0E0MD32_ORYPU
MEATAAAAACEVKPANSAALSCTAMAAMFVLALLFVAAVAYVPPPPPPAAAATATKRISPPSLSLLICVYLFLLSAAVWRDTATPPLLVRVSAFFLLADSLVAPLAGEVAMFAATTYSAAAVGYAVAERRHHQASPGTGRTSDADAAAEATPAERHHHETSKKFIAFAVFLVEAMPFGIFYLAPPQPTAAPGDDDDVPSPAATALCMAASFSGPYLAGWALSVTNTLMRACFISGDTMWIVMPCLGVLWLVVPAIAGGAVQLFVVLSTATGSSASPWPAYSATASPSTSTTRSSCASQGANLGRRLMLPACSSAEKLAILVQLR